MINEIIKKFDKYTPYINGWENMKRAAVSILLVDDNNETKILFQVRALNMRSQPGDISLPGGMIEKNESPKDAVTREICEELGLNDEDFTIVSELDILVMHYGIIIHPYLGYIKNYNNININKDEVDHIFLVPIDELIKINPIEDISTINIIRNNNFPYHLINTGKNYKFMDGVYKSLFYKYKDYVIWGMTALIIENFFNIIKE